MAAPALGHYIGGRWTVPPSARSLEVWNPSTGDPIGTVPLGGAAEVDAAVRAAREALPAWRDTPPLERARAVGRLRERLEAGREELARLVARENGKTLKEARGSVRRGIEAAEFAAGAPALLQGSALRNVGRGVDAVEYREPVGVVAGITPFNFPVMIPLWMAPLALVCGNTFVLKPSERVPFSAERIVRLAEESGLPPGVLNLVHGGPEAVEAITDHPHIDAVAFVGSAPVARTVYARSSAAGKRVLALAGAKNHLIVLPDADLAPTVEAVVASAYGQAGERCLAGSVVVAVEPGADRLVFALAERVRGLRVGPADDPATEVGPLIRPEQRQRVAEWVERGRAEGAQVVAVGTVPAAGGGFFHPPVLFDGVRPEMAIAQEEIFGPVLCVVRVGSLAEGIDLANRSRYGNAAAVFTRDGRAAREFAHGIQAGMVGVNVGVPAPLAQFPFVGWKGSVFGSLAATGREALEFYTRTKVVTSRWF